MRPVACDQATVELQEVKTQEGQVLLDAHGGGGGALAALEAARRNGELGSWRRTRRLPAGRLPPGERQAA